MMSEMNDSSSALPEVSTMRQRTHVPSNSEPSSEAQPVSNSGFAPSVDFYQRVPSDLTETTVLGAIMSLICITIMTVLFLSETIAFAKSSTSTSIYVDDTMDSATLSPQIRINFDLSFFALPCEYLSLNVLDSLGANRQNITKNVDKWHLDHFGQKRGFHGKNKEQRDIRHDDPKDLAEEHGTDDELYGDHPLELKIDNYDSILKEHPVLFINYFAPWCVWCQRLHPTWDRFAKVVKDQGLAPIIASVDCVDQHQLCSRERIRAFPTLRWFENGHEVNPDYHGDRTVEALVQFSKNKAASANIMKDNPQMKEHLAKRNVKSQEGCRVSGHLMVNRVPGNFNIEARSKHHELNIAMTNLSHAVNHLSFGEKEHDSQQGKRILKHFPITYKNFNPLDSLTYITSEFHKAFHHNVKVVSTYYNRGGSSTFNAYQILAQSQVVEYNDYNVPEARFSYDISPMGVSVSKEGRVWYDYVTSLLAIIGGTFTTLGLVDATLYKVFKSKKL